METILSLFKGFITGASLIIAIGVQNIFVLKQGLQKQHVFATALAFSLSDTILIVLGIAGLSKLFTSNAPILFIAQWGGATFLFWYGLRAFKAMLNPHTLQTEGSGVQSLKKTLLTVALLSFLNPHAYLDTVVLLGTIGSQLPPFERELFALGAILASFVWFFSLGYGARYLAPLLKMKNSWRIIDCLTGCIMWGIGFSLLLS